MQVSPLEATSVEPLMFPEVVDSPAVNVAVVAEDCPDRITAKSTATTWFCLPCWKKPPGSRGWRFFADAAVMRFCAADDEAFAAG